MKTSVTDALSTLSNCLYLHLCEWVQHYARAVPYHIIVKNISRHNLNVNACPSLHLLWSWCFVFSYVQPNIITAQEASPQSIWKLWAIPITYNHASQHVAVGKSQCISSILQKEIRQKRGQVSLKWVPCTWICHSATVKLNYPTQKYSSLCL